MHSVLNRVIANAKAEALALRAFTDWPFLERIAVAYVDYVSPWIIVAGESMAERVLQEALRDYDGAHYKKFADGKARFLERIARSAETLARFRISVLSAREEWAIWHYDQPLMQYMSSQGRHAVQIRERDTPIAVAPVMIKLLAAISTTQDLELAGIDLKRLLQNSEMV